jgi:hypothetical protein
MRKMDHNGEFVNRRPKLYHLSYANECERSASQVMLIHNTLVEGQFRESEFIMAKYRNGIGGDNVIYPMYLNTDTKVYKPLKELTVKPQDNENANVDPADNRFNV